MGWNDENARKRAETRQTVKLILQEKKQGLCVNLEYGDHSILHRMGKCLHARLQMAKENILYGISDYSISQLAEFPWSI